MNMWPSTTLPGPRWVAQRYTSEVTAHKAFAAAAEAEVGAAAAAVVAVVVVAVVVVVVVAAVDVVVVVAAAAAAVASADVESEEDSSVACGGTSGVTGHRRSSCVFCHPWVTAAKGEEEDVVACAAADVVRVVVAAPDGPEEYPAR